MNNQRVRSIDTFRGLASLGMVMANHLAGTKWIPAALKHAADIGYTIVDLVAPMFIFAIGLTYRLSAERRLVRDGISKTTLHFLIRYLAILGIGALFSAGEEALLSGTPVINWGVLQSIGISGMITLIFIQKSTWARLGAGLAILALYQFLLDRFWLENVLVSPHGGLLGSLSWAGMLILSTAIADLFHTYRPDLRNLTFCAVFSLLLGLGLSLWFPISKNRVSATYILVSIGLSGMIFSAVHTLVERLGLRFQLLALWGKHPLALYILHLLLLGIITLPQTLGWYRHAPVWLVFAQAAVILTILTLLAFRLEKKRAQL